MLVALSLTPIDFFSDIRFHPVPLVVILAGVAWYWSRVRRVDASGTPWPRWRIAAFALTVALIAAATLSGLDAYLRTSFSVHAVQQLGLFMLAPPFLALSAPVTLAVESTTPESGERIRRVVTGPVGKVVLNPALSWPAYAAALFALYFGGQYRLGVEHAWMLQLTNLELLVVGYLFISPVIGSDPKPFRLAVGWRVLYLLVLTVFYAVLGMAMESQRHPIAPGLTVSDLHTGGGDVWSTAELFTIAATIGVLVQWLRVDEGHARRADKVNAEEDARQLAIWRANRREAALADVRASESLIVRSRPSGTDRSERSFSMSRSAGAPEDDALAIDPADPRS